MWTLTFEKGNKIRCKETLNYDDTLIPAGVYTIVAISKNRSGSIEDVGIRSEQPLPYWGNLSGKVPDKHGLWVTIDFIYEYFTPVNSAYKAAIKDTFMFKKKDLKGKPCKVVGNLSNSKIAFIELQENVDGCSADGLGKAGHCILIPKKHLKKIQ